MASQAQAPTAVVPAEYWDQARQPLVSLAFLVPLLLTYEIGVFWVGGGDPQTIRNGADSWLRSGLESLGLHHPVLLPALVVAGLLIWHRAGNYGWRVPFAALAGMLAESLLFAFLLVVVGQMTDFVFQNLGPTTLALRSQAVAQAITFVGAGIYEEVLFRLCLLPVCFYLFRLTGTSDAWASVLAVLASSLTFSLAHYIGPAADAMTLFSFTFRTLAGIFFGTLFFARGFGVTVGCHAAYDLLVGILLTVRG